MPNIQRTRAPAALRVRVHASTSAVSVRRSGIRRSRHCADKMPCRQDAKHRVVTDAIRVVTTMASSSNHCQRRRRRSVTSGRPPMINGLDIPTATCSNERGPRNRLVVPRSGVRSHHRRISFVGILYLRQISTCREWTLPPKCECRHRQVARAWCRCESQLLSRVFRVTLRHSYFDDDAVVIGKADDVGLIRRR